jgi:RNA polymerase sigma factor (sigma-70 family)
MSATLADRPASGWLFEGPGPTKQMDDAELREFVHTQYPRLVGAVALLCGSRASAEDAVQEALARGWERSLRGERIESLPAWVTTVSMNLARSGLRRLRTERRHRAELRPEAEDATGQAETRVDLWRALGKLSRRQREATVLRYYLGLDVREIAEVMGTPEGTTKSLLSRARSMLAEELRVSETTEVSDRGDV